MEGVTKVLEAEVNSPLPVDAEYQSITFPAEDAEIETVPVPQRAPSVPVGEEGTVFTVAVTVVRVVETQPVADVLDSA